MKKRNRPSERPKLERYAKLALLGGPTPVRRLSRLYPTQEVWLKDDSATHSVYGGNKPRKLEFLLGEAKRSGRGVITFGFESSNHALATAYHGAQHKIPVHLVLVRGPDGLSPADVKSRLEKLELFKKLGCEITMVESYSRAAMAGSFVWLKKFGRSMIIPPGGSNALGTLGYVGAALELEQQIKAGALPEPSEIFVPLGTGGTAVGLAIGLAAVGMKTHVTAVKVVPGPVNEIPQLLRLARKVGGLLPEVRSDALKLSNLSLYVESLGKGYGQPTIDGLHAIEKAAAEDLALEATYSAKAFAAMARTLASYAAAEAPAGPILFWLTYCNHGKIF